MSEELYFIDKIVISVCVSDNISHKPLDRFASKFRPKHGNVLIELGWTFLSWMDIDLYRENFRHSWVPKLEAGSNLEKNIEKVFSNLILYNLASNKPRDNTAVSKQKSYDWRLRKPVFWLPLHLRKFWLGIISFRE